MNDLVVKDLMWPKPELVSPNATLKEAAARMEEKGCGVLPVGSDSRVEGIITDRDIVIRAISKGKDPDSERVSTYMTTKVHFCKETDSIRDAAELMKKNNIGRLAVMGPDNKLSGILSFGHILRNDAEPEEVADVVTRVAERSNGHDSARAGIAH
ncbi:MAG: CBS domain-containing protein [Alphaproteobacteria bacterium]